MAVHCWLGGLVQAAALRHVRPGDFESFAAFASWRRHAGQLLVALLVSAASAPADRGPRDAELDPAARTRVARCARMRFIGALREAWSLSLLGEDGHVVDVAQRNSAVASECWLERASFAGPRTTGSPVDHNDTDRRLRGALRRLDVPDALGFDEAEYADAADWVFQAAQDIADESRRVLLSVVMARGNRHRILELLAGLMLHPWSLAAAEAMGSLGAQLGMVVPVGPAGPPLRAAPTRRLRGAAPTTTGTIHMLLQSQSAAFGLHTAVRWDFKAGGIHLVALVFTRSDEYTGRYKPVHRQI